MNTFDLLVDDFCAWLCAHEAEPVGQLRSCFHSPLARWLSERFGHVYGVDGRWYGRALYAPQSWSLLPRWAELFASRLERLTARPVTGLEALEVLAHIELLLRAPRAR